MINTRSRALGMFHQQIELFNNLSDRALQEAFGFGIRISVVL